MMLDFQAMRESYPVKLEEKTKATPIERILLCDELDELY